MNNFVRNIDSYFTLEFRMHVIEATFNAGNGTLSLLRKPETCWYDSKYITVNHEENYNLSEKWIVHGDYFHIK